MRLLVLFIPIFYSILGVAEYAKQKVSEGDTEIAESIHFLNTLNGLEELRFDFEAYGLKFCGKRKTMDPGESVNHNLLSYRIEEGSVFEYLSSGEKRKLEGSSKIGRILVFKNELFVLRCNGDIYRWQSKDRDWDFVGSDSHYIFVNRDALYAVTESELYMYEPPTNIFETFLLNNFSKVLENIKFAIDVPGSDIGVFHKTEKKKMYFYRPKGQELHMLDEVLDLNSVELDPSDEFI
ncbi:MAG: hypothetical protein CL677_09050 [Bdellovibrionaceae bacterium]|nr:hypothetical protein [Pseudobdellovibrionaceae bacterium]